eukprot:scaffold14_cov302-Chaetoceros_neogracile.AAC.4
MEIVMVETTTRKNVDLTVATVTNSTPLKEVYVCVKSEEVCVLVCGVWKIASPLSQIIVQKSVRVCSLLASD